MSPETRGLPATGARTTTTENGMKRWQCVICDFIYDEAAGMPAEGIAPGTRWEDVPDDWVCPECSAAKIGFEMVELPA